MFYLIPSSVEQVGSGQGVNAVTELNLDAKKISVEVNTPNEVMLYNKVVSIDVEIVDEVNWQQNSILLS